MALVFDSYPNIPSTDNKFRKPKKGASLKKMRKRLRELEERVNIMQKQLDGKCVQEEEAGQKFTEANNETKEDTKAKGGFWKRMGDAIFKALPSILRTVVPMAITAVFGRKWSKRSAMA